MTVQTALEILRSHSIPSIRTVLEFSISWGKRFGSSIIGTEHFLLALAEDEAGISAGILEEVDLNTKISLVVRNCGLIFFEK